MSTRFRLGKGFTIGRSGLRYGHSVPGVRRSYVSVGKSGTLLAGFGVRHWSPGKRRAVASSGPDHSSERYNRYVVTVGVVFLVLIVGFFAFIRDAEQDYAKSQETPAATIDCATDPHPELYFACTATPVSPTPYRRP